MCEEKRKKKKKKITWPLPSRSGLLNGRFPFDNSFGDPLWDV
jgi:hypothetical protein